VRRSGVTVSGSYEELVCVACSRSRPLRIVEPYRPMRKERSASLEKILSPRRDVSHGRGEEMEDAMLPKDCRASVFDE